MERHTRERAQVFYLENFKSQGKTTGQLLHNRGARPHMTSDGYHCEKCHSAEPQAPPWTPWILQNMDPKLLMTRKKPTQGTGWATEAQHNLGIHICLLLRQHKASLLDQNPF